MSDSNKTSFRTSAGDGDVLIDGVDALYEVKSQLGYIDKVAAVAGSTASATGGTIPNLGVTLVSSTQANAYYTLTKPTEAGMRKDIIVTAATTGLLVVINSSGATFDGTNQIATANLGTTGLCNLGLISSSATRWQIIRNTGGVAFSTS